MPNPNIAEAGKPFRFTSDRNPRNGGRPRKRPISERYNELAELLLPEKDRVKLGLPVGSTYGDALVLSVYKAALAGRTDAAREIRESIEGRAPQRMQAAVPEKCETLIRVVYDREKPRGSIEAAEGAPRRKLLDDGRVDVVR